MNTEEVKKALKAKELKYLMLFPAWLRVVADSKTWLFESLEEAWDWPEGKRPTGKRQGDNGKPSFSGTEGGTRPMQGEEHLADRGWNGL
ncbi:hypothetical protein NDU88_003807 [Pleurodeles waltl]|uniref:Uncharacterized protein n=1 Tax=Pleurodeles waltl TaxID=8319 RepID=A0AAV7RG81_PLEWA|nr:hypothetical protein NDU88_003807 [Pleurodeles waltl]